MLVDALIFCTLSFITCFETPTVAEVKAEIVLQAQNSPVSVEEATQVAKCESSFKWDAKNPNSSATGVFQWTLPSWKYIKAKGDRTDYKENIRQFVKWYPVHPEWWKDCRPKKLRF